MAFERNTSARGNALFLILIAVALFAALSYAVTQSGRGGGNVSKEQELLQVSQMIQYVGAIQQAVMRLRISGCTDTLISFENALEPGYTNPSAPADKSCHVFDLAGGGLTYVAPSGGISGGLPYLFTGFHGFASIGVETEAELAVMLPISSATACAEINRRLGLPSARAIDVMGIGGPPPKFTGTYAIAGTWNYIPDNGGNEAGYAGAPIACFEALGTPGFYPSNAGVGYFLYNVIIER